MRILLVRPVSPNERFGLGPFFRVEPLGLEYIASALRRKGHEVKIADLRFSRPLRSLLRWYRPRVVGIANMHAVDIPSSLQAAREVKQYNGSITTLLGGHSAAAYPSSLFDPSVDAIAVEDGEVTVPAVVEVLERGRPLGEAAGLFVRKTDDRGNLCFERTGQGERVDLDDVPLPARDLVAPFQKNYLVVHKAPLWAIETARGCPYRCSFCSIWRLMERSFRMRSIPAVAEDFTNTGHNIFVVDDLFWHPQQRSLELGEELVRRGLRKDLVLVQARLDTVARAPEVLKAWRPLARYFDIFFGFEAPTDQHLEHLDKDLRAQALEEGVRVAREFNYGVTGNFVIDPDWGEEDFQALWDTVDRLKLTRAGYTILTPLPGTPLFDQMVERIVEKDWSKFDMHHILFEPRLGRRRFFELFTQCWRRNVLGPAFSVKNWLKWLREIQLAQIPLLVRTLHQTQRVMDPEAYLREAFPLQIPAR